jgi:ADP-heptose:LPS heptosyltransferase
MGAVLIDGALQCASRTGLIHSGAPVEQGETISTVLLLSLDHLGDAILATPALEALKTRRPEVRLTVMCRPANAPVFEASPHVDAVMTDEAPWWSSSPVRASLAPRYWRRYAKTVARLRRDHYDVIVDLRGDLRHLVLFGLFARPRILLGYDRTGGGVLLSARPPYPEDLPEIDKKLALLRPLGVEGTRPAAKIWVRPEEIDAARRRISASGVTCPVVVLDPGAKPVQQWPAERFAHVARRLRDQTGVPTLVSAGPGHSRLANRVAHLAGAKAIRFLGDLSVRQLIALIAAADLVISADTGIAHVAAAVETPAVTLFGPTDPGRFWHAGSPSEVVRSPAACCCDHIHDVCRFSRPGQHGKCMLDINPEDVVAAALRVLDRAREAGLARRS